VHGLDQLCRDSGGNLLKTPTWPARNASFNRSARAGLTKMTTENVEATKEAGVAELKATKKARAAKQAPPPVVYCLEAPLLPTASALTALTPTTLRPSDS
jgi:hypothetical protein